MTQRPERLNVLGDMVKGMQRDNFSQGLLRIKRSSGDIQVTMR